MHRSIWGLHDAHVAVLQTVTRARSTLACRRRGCLRRSVQRRATRRDSRASGVGFCEAHAPIRLSIQVAARTRMAPGVAGSVLPTGPRKKARRAGAPRRGARQHIQRSGSAAAIRHAAAFLGRGLDNTSARHTHAVCDRGELARQRREEPLGSRRRLMIRAPAAVLDSAGGADGSRRISRARLTWTGTRARREAPQRNGRRPPGHPRSVRPSPAPPFAMTLPSLVREPSTGSVTPLGRPVAVAACRVGDARRVRRSVSPRSRRPPGRDCPA